MQVVTGSVVRGKVILEGASLPEGTVVVDLTKESPDRMKAGLLHRARHASH